MVQVQGLTKVRVREKWSGRSTIIDDELIPEEAKSVQFSNADLMHNFSKAGACLKFPKGQYLSLLTLFPTLQSRPLCRRLSDEFGATEPLNPTAVSAKVSSTATGPSTNKGKATGKGKTKNKAGRGSGPASAGADASAAIVADKPGVKKASSTDVPSPVEMEEGIAAALANGNLDGSEGEQGVEGKNADEEGSEVLKDGCDDEGLEE
eukprot:105050-Amphidinium_carterae.2